MHIINWSWFIMYEALIKEYLKRLSLKDINDFAAKNKIIIGYYATKTDALEALGRLSSFPLTERYNLTFSDVYSQWSEEHFSEIGPSGVETYENAYRIFSSLHNAKFRSLRKKDFPPSQYPQRQRRPPSGLLRRGWGCWPNRP